MKSELRHGERYRIEHRSGPRSGPLGECSTIIRHGKDVTVDHTDAVGLTRRFVATLVPGVYERLLETLHKAGFPDAPHERIRSGGTRLISAIAEAREIRTRPMPYHSDSVTWAEVFSLFDAIISETSDGVA